MSAPKAAFSFAIRPVLRRRRLFVLAPLGFVLALSCLTALSRVARAGDAAADFRIIVHPANASQSVSRDFMADAFLKKVTRWESGETIRPLDQRPGAAVRRAFTDSVLKRTVSAVRSYWQQRIFSGRDVPPPELDSDENVIAYVAQNPGAVGYVSGSAKLGGTRELRLR
jgi:ABC-type phosphate transport system substrate-binding protein